MASVTNVLLRSSLLVLLALSCSVSGAIAAKTLPTQKPAQRHELTNSELVEILRTAKVTDNSYSLSATQTGDELIVSTQQNPKFNENDTKVQGVLIAKTAFDVLPDSIQRTKILFHDIEGGTFNEVLINRTVIETYGKGLMDEKKLLGSLEIEKKGAEQTSEAPENALTVVAGPLQEERILVLTRIQFIKKKGAEVSKPESEFAEAEKLAAANDRDGVKAKLSEIKTILDEQRTALKSAEKTQVVFQQPFHFQNKGANSGEDATRTRKDYLKNLLAFLKSKGVSVDSEQRDYELTKKSNHPGLSPKELRQLRIPLLLALTAKFKKLPKKDQAEFKNYEASLEAANAANDNGSTSKGQFGQQASNLSQATGQSSGSGKKRNTGN
jgi:hypothetical protein